MQSPQWSLGGVLDGSDSGSDFLKHSGDEEDTHIPKPVNLVSTPEQGTSYAPNTDIQDAVASGNSHHTTNSTSKISHTKPPPPK